MSVPHDVLMAGGFATDEQSGGLARFFDRKRFKETGEFKGPLVFDPSKIDERFRNLIYSAPLLYQACMRTKLDAKDMQERLQELSADVHTPEQQCTCLEMLAQTIALEHVADLCMQIALHGVDQRALDKADELAKGKSI